MGLGSGGGDGGGVAKEEEEGGVVSVVVADFVNGRRVVLNFSMVRVWLEREVEGEGE